MGNQEHLRQPNTQNKARRPFSAAFIAACIIAGLLFFVLLITGWEKTTAGILAFVIGIFALFIIAAFMRNLSENTAINRKKIMILTPALTAAYTAIIIWVAASPGILSVIILFAAAIFASLVYYGIILKEITELRLAFFAAMLVTTIIIAVFFPDYIRR